MDAIYGARWMYLQYLSHVRPTYDFLSIVQRQCRCVHVHIFLSILAGGMGGFRQRRSVKV